MPVVIAEFKVAKIRLGVIPMILNIAILLKKHHYYEQPSSNL
jgi:hypothetical protein